MSWFRSRSGLIAGAFALGVLTVVAAVAAPRAPLLGAVMLLALGAGLLWLIGLYWRSLDEAARAAQQSAWFWGGSIGMGLALASLMPPTGALWLPADVDPVLMAPFGGLVVAAGAMIGFLVGWAAWWIRRR
jgi:hypothetical protein